MVLHRKWSTLTALAPDVAIVPESAHPDIVASKCPEFDASPAVWKGRNRNKGLAVRGFGDDSVELLTESAPENPWAPLVQVRGPVEFLLLAVWANNKRPYYDARRGSPALRAIRQHAARLESGDAVVAGDFNNKVIWDRPGRETDHPCDGAGAAGAGSSSQRVGHLVVASPKLQPCSGDWTMGTRRRLWLPRLLLAGSMLALLCNCASLATKARRANEALMKTEAAGAEYAIPYAIAWNATYDFVRGRSEGVVTADPDRGLLVGNWGYRHEDRKTSRTESRRRVRATFASRQPIRVTVAEDVESRDTQLGGDPGPWQVTEAVDKGARVAYHEHMLGAELRWREAAPLTSPPEGARPEVARALSASFPDVSDPADGGGLETGWRLRDETVDGTRIEFRERVVLHLRPEGDGTRLVVDATRETRAHSGSEDPPTRWTSFSPRTVQVEVLRAVGRRVGVRQLDSEPELTTAVDPPIEPPELPKLRDPLEGDYQLVLEAALASPTKSNGKAWDVGVGALARIGAAVGVVVYGQPQMVGQATRLAGAVGDSISGPELPDLAAFLRVDRIPYETQVVRDSLGAAWGATIPLRLSGREPGVVHWTVYDVDIQEHDLIGSGSFTLRELADSGGVVEFSNGGIESIRFRLVRVSD